MKRLDSILPLIAALVVMGSAMWKAETTVMVSVISFIILSLYYSFSRNEDIKSVTKKEEEPSEIGSSEQK